MAFGSEVKALRAYAESGKVLERENDGEASLVGDDSWRKIPFKGIVAEVRVDRVEKWGEVAVDYDLPPAPKWPASQQGLVPPLQERMKETPGGRVVKQVKKE